MSLPPFPVRVRQFAPLALVLISAVLAVCAYLQALGYPFVSDDEYYITKNARLAGLQLSELWLLFVKPYNFGFEFLPLRDFSYWLDIALFGLAPSVFRAHNIFLYLLCLPLVYATTLELWRYFRPADAASAPWAAAAVTALFALHPALVESVVWVSGRKYVLPNLFSMLALWLAVRARREQGLSAPHAAAALVAFAAVMFSKASYVAVAPVIAMLWVVFWRDIPLPQRRRSLLLWPLAILLLAAFLLLVFIVHNDGFDTAPAYFGVEAATRSLAVLGGLARIAISPEGRHFFHPVFEDPHLPVMVAFGVAVLGAAGWGAAMLLCKRSLAGFALVVFLLLCMPYMQLVPAKPPSLVSDRYVALAVWPAILLLVALSWRLKAVLGMALLLAFALPWGFQTIERPRDWHSFEALVDTDLRAYPGYYVPAFYKIFSVQLRQGLVREAMETANSITMPEFRDITIRLIEIDHAVTNANATGNPQEAVNLLRKLLPDLKQPPIQAKWNLPIYNIWERIRGIFENQWNYLGKRFPDDALVHYNAGLWMVDVQKYKEAVAHLRVATESQRLPESVRGAAFQNLGLALLGSGQIAEAEPPLLTALKQPQPDMRIYCLLAMVYKQTGRLAEAAHAGTKCLGAPDKEIVQ